MPLNQQQQQWFTRYIDNMRIEANNPRPTFTSGQNRALYDAAIAAYNTNPVNALRAQVLTALRTREGIPPGTPLTDGQQDLFNQDFETAFANMRRAPSSDMLPANLDGIVRPPSNPMSMFNPMSWLGSLGDIIDRVPILRQVSRFMTEMFQGLRNGEGPNFGAAWQRAGVRMAMEDAFSNIPDAQRRTMIENAMASYRQTATTGQLPQVTPSGNLLQNSHPLVGGRVFSGTDPLTQMHDIIVNQSQTHANLDDAIMRINLPPNTQHTLVRLQNGEIAIVSGSQNGQSFTPSHMTRIHLDDGNIFPTQTLPANSAAFPLLTRQEQAQQAVGIMSLMGLGGGITQAADTSTAISTSPWLPFIAPNQTPQR